MSEPSPVVLGVDVGTTYTAAALADGDRVAPLTLGTRSFTIPSTLYLPPSGEIAVGEAAERRALEDPASVARHFKKRVGDETPMIVGGTPWPPELLFSKLQRWVWEQAKTDSGRTAEHVVLTHPASWGPYRLEVLEQAAQQAGIPEPMLVSEPAAAATFHATECPVAIGRALLVYDFGGGTFDAAVLRQHEHGFEIVGEPQGIDGIGGMNIDEALLRFVDESAGGVLDELDPDDPSALEDVAELRRRCIAAKEALASDMVATVAVRFAHRTADVRVTRDDLRQMTTPLVGQTILTLYRAMTSAGVEVGDVDALLLVGGSSQLPVVAEHVNELGLPVVCHPSPKLAVCQGAAVYGQLRLAPTPIPSARAEAPAPPPAATRVVAPAPEAPAPEPVIVPSVAPQSPAPTPPPTPPVSPVAVAASFAPAETPRRSGFLAMRIGAAVLAVLTVVAAYAGIGTSSVATSSPAGIVLGASGGTDARPAEVDLSKPIPIRIARPPIELGGAGSVEVDVSVGPTPLFSSDRAPLTFDNGAATATIDISSDRFLVAGRFHADVKLLDAGGRVVAKEPVAATASGLGFGTVPGVVIGVLLLVIVAVIETLARTARRSGQAKPTLVARLAGASAMAGVLAVALAWLVDGPEPSITTALVCAVTGGVAGLLLGLSPRARAGRPQAGDRQPVSV